MAPSVLKWEAFDPVRRSMVALRGFLCRLVNWGNGTLRRGFIGMGLESFRSAKSPAGPPPESTETAETVDVLEASGTGLVAAAAEAAVVGS